MLSYSDYVLEYINYNPRTYILAIFSIHNYSSFNFGVEVMHVCYNYMHVHVQACI